MAGYAQNFLSIVGPEIQRRQQERNALAKQAREQAFRRSMAEQQRQFGQQRVDIARQGLQAQQDRNVLDRMRFQWETGAGLPGNMPPKEEVKIRTEREQARPEATAHLGDTIANLDRMIEQAKAVRDDENLSWGTGLTGAIPRNIPGTQTYDWGAKLDTLKSQIGFAVLQNMRDMSKTGGALGQVSERENVYLQQNLAAIDPKQSTGGLKKNLDQVIRYAEGAKSRLRKAYQGTYGALPDEGSPAKQAPATAMPAAGGWQIEVER